MQSPLHDVSEECHGHNRLRSPFVSDAEQVSHDAPEGGMRSTVLDRTENPDIKSDYCINIITESVTPHKLVQYFTGLETVSGLRIEECPMTEKFVREAG